VFVRKFKICAKAFLKWVVPEKIHTPPTEEISAIQRGRGKKLFLMVGGINFQFPQWEWYGCFLE
jgi:hypothetical protein